VFDVFEEDGSLHAIGRVRSHAAGICSNALSQQRWMSQQRSCFWDASTALQLAACLLLLPSLPSPLLARR
jgi:hypothetical protein